MFHVKHDSTKIIRSGKRLKNTHCFTWNIGCFELRDFDVSRETSCFHWTWALGMFHVKHCSSKRAFEDCGVCTRITRWCWFCLFDLDDAARLGCVLRKMQIELVHDRFRAAKKLDALHGFCGLFVGLACLECEHFAVDRNVWDAQQIGRASCRERV